MRGLKAGRSCSATLSPAAVIGVVARDGKGRSMALLESLPEAVQNSLRELQSQQEVEADVSHNGSSGNGHKADAEPLSKPQESPAPLPSTATEETDPPAVEEASDLVPVERPLVFATDITARGAFGE